MQHPMALDASRHHTLQPIPTRDGNQVVTARHRQEGIDGGRIGDRIGRSELPPSSEVGAARPRREAGVGPEDLMGGQDPEAFGCFNDPIDI